MEITPINTQYAVTYNKPNIEYQKITVRVNNNEQQTMVYTYDKHGNLIETVLRKHDIGFI